MRLAELLNEMKRRDIRLFLEGARLRCEAPRNALDDDIRAAIKLHDRQIRDLLAPQRDGAMQVRRAPRAKRQPLSFAQQRLWFLAQLDPAGVVYNIPQALRLRGKLDVPALERSLNEIVRRHEILRTRYEVEDDVPVQVVDEAADFRLEVEDLEELPTQIRESRLLELVQKAIARPFDLTRGPMIRGTLVLLSDDGAEPERALVLVLHHIVTDDWSSAILFRELAALYASFANGRACNLPTPTLQYVDFALSQREWLQGERLTKLLDYWTEKLANNVPSVSLPTRSSRRKGGGAGAEVHFEIDPVLRGRLQDLSRDAGVTRFVVMLSAFYALLYRYSGQADISVGAPIANRNIRDIEEIMGFFVNTLVLRARIEPSASFRALLEQTQQIALEAQAHQDLPFERLVEALGVREHLAVDRSPLFRVAFVFHNIGFEDPAIPGFEIEPIAGIERPAVFDLILHIAESEAGLRGWLEYDAGLFECAAMSRFAAHYLALIDGAIVTPDMRIAELPLIAGDERHRLLTKFNDTGADYSRNACLHELFELQAARTPQAPALTFGEERLSYSELDERAERLANRLRVEGVGPDMIVGVCLERSLEMVIALIGVLKAGGAYLPLDPENPDERIAYMVDDAGVGLVLTQRRFVERQPTSARTLCFDGDDIITAPPNIPSPAPVFAQNLAYVIYTSGSTGRPKGVAVQHGGVVNRIEWMQQRYHLGADDVVLQKTPFAFDVSVWEFFWPLLFGAQMVIAAPGEHRDAIRLAELIRDHGITTLHFVPSMLEAFQSVVDISELELLRRVICSGEGLPAATARRFLSATKAELHNLYGPTEASIDVSFFACTPGEQWERIPIGRPIANTKLHVLNSEGILAPIGVVGELHIGGVGLARGYVGRPDLTAERFVPSPFGDGKRLYRTGDLAKFEESGDLVYMGRIDHQVKVRGFRIELGEIEAALAREPSIREALVVAREGAGGAELIAYVTPAIGASPEIEVLRSRLAERLPDYMIPRAIMILDALPLTPNGKVDRKQLPTPQAPDEVAEGPVVASSATAEMLAGIFAEVLDLERVGRKDDFFALGGHSLLATKAISRIRRAFAFDLPLRSLFEHPTIDALAPFIDEGRARGSGTLAPPLTRAPRDEDLPLSFAQQRLWFLDQLEPESSFYCVPIALRLHGPLQESAVRVALEGLTQRHETLRTIFPSRDGRAAQKILPQGSVRLRRVDLRASAFALRETEVSRLLEEEALRPFDLSRGPLLRATLIALADDEHVLALTLHHIISDGWSIDILVRDFAGLYAAILAGEEPALPPLPIQYADFSYWQRRWLQGVALTHQLDYWRKTLEGAAPALDLPTDHPRPATQTYSGAKLRFEVPPETAEGLRRAARQSDATLFMILLASYATLLMRCSGQRDISIGTPIANRSRIEIEGLIGFFVNTLVIRSDLSGDPAFADFLHRVRETVLEAQAHQDLPFEKLVEELQPNRDPARHPFFQTVLVLQNAPLRDLTLPELRVDVEEPRTRTAKFDLMVTLEERDGTLLGEWEYNTDLLERETIERLSERYLTLLAGVAATPGARLSELPILGERERERLSARFEGASMSFPQRRRLHELFEAQALRTPGATAVAFDEQLLSYQELDAMSNRLARRLVAEGVGVETIVGICVERSLEMVICLLGVLKAGGAYLPLDPDYPAERLAFMLENVGAPLVLAQSRFSERLPPAKRLVLVDSDWPSIMRESAAPVAVAGDPSNLAYVIYTSGSTGQPKGVGVAHENVGRLFAATETAFAFSSADVWTLFHSFAFDFSVWEIWGALLYGGRLAIVPYWVTRSSDEFHSFLRDNDVTVLNQTPSSFYRLMESDAEGMSPLDRLRLVIFGGEALAPYRLADWYARHPNAPALVNMYGITETTVHVTLRPLRSEDAERKVSDIGEPLADLRLYLLDGVMQPVPDGAPGELYVGGAGLARGYIGRPDLTAERFLPDPFGPAGERLYRTGDLARCLSDGRLEYFGRADQQVKVRGFRIELGEIESMIARRPDVREAAVVARQGKEDDSALVAYVTPAIDVMRESEASVSEDTVDAWRSVFEQTWDNTDFDGAGDFNTSGWVSSYTGELIAGDEMREWVEATVDRILEHHPSKILEIGCGTGLLLLRIAPHCETYVATDYSKSALGYVARQIAGENESYRGVELRLQAANSFAGLEERRFDTVVVNSVVQYFPDVDYLLRMIEGALRLLEDGGRLIIGDVRNLALVRAFHAEARVSRASPNLTCGELSARIARGVLEESELLLHPQFFSALAANNRRVVDVDILVKRGRYRNEMSQFRYDAVLHIGPARREDAGECELLDWFRSVASLDALRRHLEHTDAPHVIVRNVPNARCSEAIELLEDLARARSASSLGELRGGREPGEAVDPEAVWSLSAPNYSVKVDWSRGSSDGSFDIRCTRSGVAPRQADLTAFAGVDECALRALANSPATGRLARGLASELRAYLKQRLPDYMVPSAIVVLDRLPITTNGKVDRKVLPAPDFETAARVGDAAARTPTEEILCGIFAEVLGLARVGVGDDFFALGGHSLLATQVVSRIRRNFEIELPLRSLFEHSSVAGIAPLVEAARGAGLSAPPLIRTSRDADSPLSFAQQRLWFLDQLEPGSSFYCIPTALRLRGRLDRAALEEALRGLAARHEVLRTRFPICEGKPTQRIVEESQSPLRRIDLSGFEAEHRETELRRLIDADAATPFDLAEGPLMRATLFSLGESDHALALMLHHIVADGWSIDILIRDFVESYSAACEGRAASLPDLPVQYVDFANWQRGWLKGDALDRQLDYWRRKLEGAPPALELPIDHPRPALQSYRGGELHFEVPASLADRLRAVARSADATSFMILLAAFEALLMRLGGQREICVGTPIANRTRLEIEGLIGFFVNTLVMRADGSDDPPFEKFLTRVRETALEAQAHQDLPFEKLVEELQPLRDPSRNPIFQAMFALQNAPLRALAVPGLDIEVMDVETKAAQFDLSLSMQENESGLLGVWEYSADLFEPETIARFCGHFLALLEGIASTPSARLSEFSLLSDRERGRLLFEFNDTAVGFPDDVRVHELFEAQARRAPDAIALSHGGKRLSYRELNERADGVARRLRAEGVGSEAIVGICVERSPEMVAALLGVLKAHGAYLPLDPDYPSERLRFMIEDAGAEVVLTQAHLASRLPADLRLLRLDDDCSPAIAARAAERDAAPGGPDNLAYVIYTSGSTGRPKGVGVPHRGIVNLIAAQIGNFDLSPESRVLQLATISFDLAVEEIFPTLCSGGTLVLSTLDRHESLGAFLDFVSREGVTVLTVATLVWKHLTDWLAETGSSLPECVRVLCVGGEKASGETLAQWRALVSPRVAWINTYGPTEASVTTTAFALVSTGEAPTEAPIGRPIANVRVHVLDRRLEPTPIGVAGELFIGGVGLARGYLGRPELTAERFVPNPFGDSGDRLYRTGDLAKYRPDGNLDYVGRIDDQVKVRGYRIELGEIEARLLEHPLIRAAVAIVGRAAGGEKRIIAYVVPRIFDGFEPSLLEDFVTASLPAYMAPSAIIALEALPTTISGKIDRRALPDPGDEARVRQSSGPASRLETMLIDLFAETLGGVQVAVDDDFFALGGHSLLAYSLAHHIRETLRCNLPLVALFQNPSARRLAGFIGERRKSLRRTVVELRPGDEEHVLYCVHPAGSVACYLPLANELPGRFAVHGLDSRAILDPNFRPESIFEMASEYVEEITRRGAGPYRLLGWSLGGLIAHAMAFLLEERGEEVAFLGLLDTRLHEAIDDERRFELFAVYLRNRDPADHERFLAMNDDERIALEAAVRGLEPAEWFSRVAEYGQRRGLWLSNMSLAILDSLFDEWWRAHLLSNRYDPPRLCCDMHVWWAKASLTADGVPPVDWRPYVGGHLILLEAEGDHETIVRDPAVVSAIAERLGMT